MTLDAIRLLAHLAALVAIVAFSFAGAATICLALLWMQHPLAQCCTVAAGAREAGR
jgi:cytochrome bd-type quinol oxidase subunit 1